jgi:hypothetical protein
VKRTRIPALLAAGLTVGALLAVGGPALAKGGDDDDDRDRGALRADDRDERGDDRRGGDRLRERRAKRREIRTAGRCSAAGRSKIKVKGEDRGRIEMEFEVDQNRNGHRWGVVVRRNGRVILRRAYRTRPPSGSFEARKVVRDRRGRDRFVALARNPRTGERCVARVAY